MLAKFLAWIASGALSGVVTPIMGYLNKRTDAAVEKVRVEADVTRAAALKTLETHAVVTQAQRDVILSAMTHPVFWVAWIFGVIPILTYEAMIFFVSAFDSWLNVPGCVVPAMGQLAERGRVICGWYVRRVPAEQEAIARLILESIFIAQVGTGATAGLVSAIAGRLRR